MDVNGENLGLIEVKAVMMQRFESKWERSGLVCIVMRVAN
jgi:hypothetical protein